MKKTVIVVSFLIASMSTAGFASKSAVLLESLRIEQLRINESVNSAKEEDKKLSGGLIKALIGARLELLKINSALIQQRINAIESGAKIYIKLYETEPDLARAQNIKSEMDSIRSEIRAKEDEIKKYQGGLIKVTLMSAVATMNNTLAMLQTEYLKAKYGIYWMPSINNTKNIASTPAPRKTSKSSRTQEDILIPKVTNKRYEKYKYDDNIWFDITWDTKNLKKKTRAVKGLLIFADLFGEPKFMINKTINDPLSPGQLHKEDGVGFEYNQFKDSHKWMRSTDLEDMTFRFEVKSIIYTDGTREEF